MKWLVSQQQKLIHFLQQQLSPPPSGKLLRRALEARLCRVNGEVERFGSAKVLKGSVVELSSAWQSVLLPPLNRFTTLWEEDDLIIVDKPSGWVCSDSECVKAFGSKRYLVHRLDRETTGVLLLAQNYKAREALIDLFRNRAIEKLYYAIVDGVPEKDRGICKSNFARISSFEGQTIWGSCQKGLAAETHWKVAARGKSASLLVCQPITGRTHQIRVHLAEMGHPIIIDRQYAKSYRCKLFASRPFLHAARIRFKHPFVDRQMDCSAPIPPDFQSALEVLEMQA